MPDRYLSDEQRMMRETCRRHVDDVVRPFIEANREREWLFDPAQRLPAEILEEADRTGLRGLGVPAKYGGVGLDPATEAQTFSVIATEIARGIRGWPTSWCRTGRSPCCCARLPPSTCRMSGSPGTWPTCSS